MLDPFLEHTDIVDWKTDSILRKAEELNRSSNGPLDTIRESFEWVRDHIQHSLDANRDELTCRASDVLRLGTGYCYAKSHLLAALLRANRIPAGFCYQRLSLDGSGCPFCLHGLNAVRLPNESWYRIDPRGNRFDVDAQFTPPVEQLAFAVDHRQECDYPEVWSAPLPVVTKTLLEGESVSKIASCLPDLSESRMADYRSSEWASRVSLPRKPVE